MGGFPCCRRPGGPHAIGRLSPTDTSRDRRHRETRDDPATTQLDVGPVLHPYDAVANKVIALFGRAAPRDYLDVNAALASGRYTPERLLELAEEHDAGFDRPNFAQALQAVDRWPDREQAVYGIGHSKTPILE